MGRCRPNGVQKLDLLILAVIAVIVLLCVCSDSLDLAGITLPALCTGVAKVIEKSGIDFIRQAQILTHLHEEPAKPENRPFIKPPASLYDEEVLAWRSNVSVPRIVHFVFGFKPNPDFQLINYVAIKVRPDTARIE